jgi:hypothetical protein
MEKIVIGLLTIVFFTQCNADIESNVRTDAENEFTTDIVEVDSTEKKVESVFCDSLDYELAKNYAAEELPKWKLLDSKKYDDICLEMYKPHNGILNLIDGDFNGDGCVDYGIMLFKEHKTEHKNYTELDYDISFWVFFRNEDDFKAELITEWNDMGPPEWYGIILIPEGTEVRDMYSKKELVFEHDAFEAISFESASVVYYWTESGIEEFQTGD